MNEWVPRIKKTLLGFVVEGGFLFVADCKHQSTMLGAYVWYFFPFASWLNLQIQVALFEYLE